MRRIFILSLVIALAIPLLGKPVDPITAKRLAQNFWKENNIMGARGDKVFKKKMDDARFVNVAPQCGYSEFFIFRNENGKGFVIIAADDRVTPILGYSYDSEFDAESLPPNMKEWLDGYAEQIRIAIETRATATEEIRADWDCLWQRTNLPIKSEQAVNPLITTRWKQSPYYNSQCPLHPTQNQHAVSGCVATAMAQVMKYWSYPERGIGSHSYIPTIHPEYGIISADFGSTTYQWSQMPVSLSSSSTSTQIDAVATLMFHCGVSVEMEYGLGSPYDEGSGAYTTDAFGTGHACAETALKTYFDYKNTLHSDIKLLHSENEWIEILKNELSSARPVLYTGSGTGTHSFICDGFDNSDRFHFNWGWGGAEDGFFTINALNPSSYNFSSSQQAVIGIEPNNTTYNFNLVYHSTPQMSKEEYWFFEDISVNASITNAGSGAFTGYIGAGVFIEQSGAYYLYQILDAWNRVGSPFPGGYYISGDLEHAGGPPYIPGSYELIMVYSLDGSLWTMIDNGAYNDASFTIQYASGIETFSDFTLSTGDYLYSNTEAIVNVDIINASDETFYGQFRVSLLEPSGSLVQTIEVLDCSEGLPPNYHFIDGLDFSGLINAEPGSYLLSLAFKETGASNWYYAGASDFGNPVGVYVMPEPVYEDPYEPNNSTNTAYTFPVNFSGNTASINTTGSTLHSNSDVDFYKINLSAGYDYIITPRLHDTYNSGDGNDYTVDAMFAYSTDGSNWSEFYDDVTLSSIFIEDGGTLYFHVLPYYEGNVGTYLLHADLTRTQHVTPSYTITTAANPTNGGTVTGGGSYQEGQTCTISATPTTNYTFTSWTENGNVVSTNASYTFNVTGNRTLVANFTYVLQNYTIAVSANPTEGGTVTGGGTYQEGQSCTISATPATNYTFTSWTENGNVVSTNASYTFNVTGNRTLVANFTYVPQNYTITLSTNPANSGTVTGGGTYQEGLSCTVSAQPNDGYIFINWMEGNTEVSNQANYTFTVTGNRTLTANFELKTVKIIASVDPLGSASITGENTYNYGDEVTLTVIPNEGYTFQNWTENDQIVSHDLVYTFIATESHFFVAHLLHIESLVETTVYAKVYPNPTQGEVTVECEGMSHVRIVNAYGQMVYNAPIDGEHTHIDLSQMAKGIYMMHIEAAGGQMTKKIVVE